jgi:hypothetical protein
MVKLLRRIINLFKKCKMAKINFLTAYPLATTPLSGNSILIGSLASAGDTKNFLLSDLSAYILGNAVTPTLNDVCQQGATTTTGITVAGTTTLNGTVDINNTADISGNTTIGGTLGVTGASTLDSVAVTNNSTVGGTLGVTGGATFSLGATINGAGLAVNGSGGIVVTDAAGITSSGGPVSGTALSTSGGLLVSGTSVLGEIDSAGPADIADTLTLSKASGTGLSLPSSRISVGGSTVVSSTAVTADGFQTNSASFTATSSAVQCSFGATFSAFDSTLGGTFRLIGSVPSSSTDTGSAGQIAVDATHIYVCVGTDSWGRVAIDTTPF